MPEDRSSGSDRDLTLLLRAASSGDDRARAELMDRLYAELHAIAARIYASHGSRGHTLQPTAVVHEAFLKLVGSEAASFEGRRHFLCAAARAMRQVMLNHARDKRAEKRGGGRVVVSLDDRDVADARSGLDALELEEALRSLEALDPRQARVVELRFFGGLTVEETADALELSATTVKAEWRMARAELARLLQGRTRGGAESDRG